MTETIKVLKFDEHVIDNRYILFDIYIDIKNTLKACVILLEKIHNLTFKSVKFHKNVFRYYEYNPNTFDITLNLVYSGDLNE